jgi:hypothetical protein
VHFNCKLVHVVAFLAANLYFFRQMLYKQVCFLLALKMFLNGFDIYRFLYLVVSCNHLFVRPLHVSILCHFMIRFSTEIRLTYLCYPSCNFSNAILIIPIIFNNAFYLRTEKHANEKIRTCRNRKKYKNKDQQCKATLRDATDDKIQSHWRTTNAFSRARTKSKRGYKCRDIDWPYQ